MTFQQPRHGIKIWGTKVRLPFSLTGHAPQILARLPRLFDTSPGTKLPQVVSRTR